MVKTSKARSKLKSSSLKTRIKLSINKGREMLIKSTSKNNYSSIGMDKRHWTKSFKKPYKQKKPFLHAFGLEKSEPSLSFAVWLEERREEERVPGWAKQKNCVEVARSQVKTRTHGWPWGWSCHQSNYSLGPVANVVTPVPGDIIGYITRSWSYHPPCGLYEPN